MNDELEYIKSKNIAEIFEGLLGYVYFEKPQNVVESLIGELKKLERKVNKIATNMQNREKYQKEAHCIYWNNVKNVFDSEDIEAVYNFLNLQNEKCLSQFVLNNKQREFMESAKIASNVDLEVFTSYALEKKT